MPTRPKIHRPNRNREHRTRESYDSNRGSSTQRGYGYHWQQLRLAYLNEHPLCIECEAQGLTTAANEVDHIDGDSSNNDESNLQALCKSCHSKKTVRCNGGLGQ